MAFRRQNWSVLPPGAQESMALATFTAVVKYIGPWSERLLFAESMMGFPYYSGLIDDSIPDGRGFDISNASRGISATMAAYKGGQQVIGPRTGTYSGVAWLESYELAVVTVTYKLPGVGDPIQVIDDERGRGDFISETFEPNAEFSTLDNDRFEWFDPNLPPPADLPDESKKVSEKEAPGKLFVGVDYIFTRHGVESVSDEILTAVNHVNMTTIRLVTPILRHIEFVPETVLYRGARLQHSVSLGGESKMDLVMTFGLRQVPDPGNINDNGVPIPPAQRRFYGWNHFFHAGEGRWLRLRRKFDGEIHLNFPLAELRNL